MVLTGSYETATAVPRWRPDLRLLAETSGKNAIVVTPSADLDLAVGDLVRSAFGHAGQKCSAASLGIVVGDAVRRRDVPCAGCATPSRSLRVGPATEPATMMGPLIQQPAGPLQRALTTLDAGERGSSSRDRSSRPDRPAVVARRAPRRAPGSWFHLTECFGPVLGVMRADDLDHAIALQNGTPFGLTGGIHTLDPDEIERWLEQVEVGNAYVNRHITGAIVRRQPFGGWKRSSVGGGAKAGGPGYVAQFSRVTDPTLDPVAARRSFERAAAGTFRAEHDPSALAAESNVLRYHPLRSVAVRHDRSQAVQIAVLEAAAAVLGVELFASVAEDESDADFAARCVAAERRSRPPALRGRPRRPPRVAPRRHRRRRHAFGRGRRARTAPLGS